MKGIPQIKFVFISSMITLLYFVAMKLIMVYQIDYTIIGVFAELLTIPFSLVALVLLVFAIMLWRKNRWHFEIFNITSILITLTTIILLISFFY